MSTIFYYADKGNIECKNRYRSRGLVYRALELPLSKLRQRMISGFDHLGVRNFRDLVSCEESELRQVGFSEEDISEIKEQLKEKGLSLLDSQLSS